jgi:hypothetical protein
MYKNFDYSRDFSPFFCEKTEKKRSKSEFIIGIKYIYQQNIDNFETPDYGFFNSPQQSIYLDRVLFR